MVAHAFNSNIQEAGAGEAEFEISLLYRVSPRMTRDIQRNHVYSPKRHCLKFGIPILIIYNEDTILAYEGN